MKLLTFSKFAPLFQPKRYKVFFGGRGGAKSWSFARVLIARAAVQPIRILCVREFQTSIGDSVHRLLRDQIEELGLSSYYTVTANEIRSACGALFLFKGIKHNSNEIKSLEGVDVCWVEEAQNVSNDSWDVLIPTIRKQGSEIWVCFNPLNEKDPTYQRFVINPPPESFVVKVGWEDNPQFPDTLRAEKDHLLATDYEKYANVWGGEPKKLSDAIIFKGKFESREFVTPDDARFFHGVDWGFSVDPTVMVRCFVQDEILYIDQEVYGVGVELDSLPALFDKIATARRWPIKADGARPETISHLHRKGFNIAAARKWSGSVEDGIEYLRSYKKIVAHPRCSHTLQELNSYAYKVDAKTGEVLPDIVDKHNHCIDALRYSQDGNIKRKKQGFYDV